MRRLRLLRFIAAGAPPGHFAKVRIAGAVRDLHTHDFAEVFWVDGGHGWHEIGGRRHEAARGWLQLVWPEDMHGFGAPPGEAMVIANLAIAVDRLQRLAGAYLDDVGRLGPEAAPAQRGMQLADDQLARLRAAARPLEEGDICGRTVDLVLLTALDLLARRREQTLPDWLAAGLARMRAHPERASVPALAAACGRSPEHLARCTRALLQRTPTTLLNEMRCAKASELLSATALPIPRIAEAVGLANLGHFYAVFRSITGETPASWRQRQLRVLGQPGRS